MGQFISDQLLKQLINAGSCVKGSIVTLLGFTFKENVSDIRNTRVIDIVQSLGEYGIEVQVLDPLANADEVLTEYGIELIEEQQLQAADAVILAVPHEYFINQGWAYVQNLLKDQAGVVLDVKAKLDRQAKPEAISLWRL
jgi:UDP-N-acetyl-D-galactosamine dehydrogenase